MFDEGRGIPRVGPTAALQGPILYQSVKLRQDDMLQIIDGTRPLDGEMSHRDEGIQQNLSRARTMILSVIELTLRADG